MQMLQLEKHINQFILICYKVYKQPNIVWNLFYLMIVFGINLFFLTKLKNVLPINFRFKIIHVLDLDNIVFFVIQACII